ncbi:MAG: glycosyltransferase [Chitinophagaceae bacterium]|nr:glycosyltransferase [Chitinophagaceae bacterium]
MDNSLRGRDIVVIGLQPWYYPIGSNCKNIATHFAYDNRVLYVNLPINRKTYLSRGKNEGVAAHSEIIRKKKDELKQINGSMWELYPLSVVESINRIPSNKVFSAINYFNNKRFAKDIANAVAKLGFKDIILFNDNDIYNGYHLKEFLRPSLYIYYMRDFLQGYDYWKKHTSIMEPKLIAKSDLVATNSTYYAEYCQNYNPNSLFMGQGCNLELFNPDLVKGVPQDLNDIKRPIIGYVGAIDSARLDEKIIETIATSHPEWSVVLVGPEDEHFQASSLHKLANVHFLGRRAMTQLPDYIAAFDVCINPQFDNNITIGNYPLKIDEYLAMGKPVVATRTATMKLFEDHVSLATDPKEYPALIESCLADASPEKNQSRIDFARTHDWGNAMKTLYAAINETYKKRAARK